MVADLIQARPGHNLAIADQRHQQRPSPSSDGGGVLVATTSATAVPEPSRRRRATGRPPRVAFSWDFLATGSSGASSPGRLARATSL
jgi:hypothetical protein